MLTRHQHLDFCKVCKSRKFSRELGIICQLTEKKADFTDACKNYERDQAAITQNQIYLKESSERKLKTDFTFGLDKFGIKNGIVAGIILLTIGFAWLIYGLTIGFIFWYPFVLIIMGVPAILIGIFNGKSKS